MLKTHKIALDPNNLQATQLSQHCGYARVAYNTALADFKTGLDIGQWRSHTELCRRFNAIKTETFPWSTSHSQNASKNAIYTNLNNAIGRWKSGQNRFPKFKRRSRGQSYQADSGRGTITVVGTRIKLPRDAQHKASTAITYNASRIGIESLNVAGMLKNHRLAKALADASLSSFLAMLQVKAERIGVKIVEADTFYPSSKTCSNCGTKDSDLTLSDRIYHCSDCGHTQDRDLNAAINLKHLAVGHTES